MWAGLMYSGDTLQSRAIPLAGGRGSQRYVRGEGDSEQANCSSGLQEECKPPCYAQLAQRHSLWRLRASPS